MQVLQGQVSLSKAKIKNELLEDKKGVYTMEMNAQGLASLGRGGDDQIGHLTTGEKVLPLPVAQDPSVQRVINESFAEHGLDANQYTVGHANNSINPLTDYPEYGLGKVFKKIGKAFRKVSQVVGTVVGFIYGGPAGAALGSTLGGANRRGKFDLKHAVTDAIGGYTLGSAATGMGMVGGTGGLPGSGVFGGQGISGLKAAFTPASSGGMWGWQATPTTAGGIGGFFQNVGANAASALGAETAMAGPYSGVAANIPSIGEAYGSLGMLGKAGVMGIGALAAGKMGAFDQPELQGRPEGMGLTEEQKQYLTKPLTPATTMPGVGGSSSGPMGQYQGGAGVGGLNNPNQALLDFLEEQKRKYLMQFPSFQTGQRQFGYNQGGPVPRQGYEKGGEVDTVPAMLTEDEHVLTVDAVRGLGGGDIEKGHQIAKQLNDSAEEQLQNKILERKYFMQFPEFNRGVA